jgi:hypothetical protein
MIAWAAEHPGVLRVEQAAGIGCGLNPSGTNPDAQYADACDRAVAALPGRVASLRPDVVVAMVTAVHLEGRAYPGHGLVTISHPEFFDRLRSAYEEETQGLLDAGASLVLWVAPVPPSILAQNSWADVLEPTNQSSYRAVLAGLADSMEGVAVADFASWTARQDDPPARDDGLHLSPSGAYDATERYFAPLIAELVGAADPATATSSP